MSRHSRQDLIFLARIPMPFRLSLAALLLAVPLLACAQPPPAAALTQTNEEGCTRLRSQGAQDPYETPAPPKQSCVGPYLLEFPQNYYDGQMGPEHDGSFGLALEYPSLQPFKPGERMRLSADVSARTVSIDYLYPRNTAQESLRNTYTLWGQNGDPSERLDGRIKGAPVFGLIPYYADLPRIRDYERSQGRDEGAPVMAATWHVDWYVTRNDEGEIDRLIKCTAREVPGTGLTMRVGKIVRKAGERMPICKHSFIVPAMNIRGNITYARAMLERWQDMENRARELLTAAVRKDFSEEVR